MIITSTVRPRAYALRSAKMKYPIMLRSDDGITWWKDAAKLEEYVESPDIEAGIYKAWDAQGQILKLSPKTPVTRGSFLGFETVSISSGSLSETGEFDPDGLSGAIARHLQAFFLHYEKNIPPDLESTLALLCQLQASED